MNYDTEANLSWGIPKRRFSLYKLKYKIYYKMFKLLMNSSPISNFQAGFRQGKAERLLKKG